MNVPTQAQSIATAAEVVQAMGFAEDYDSYVDLTVTGMTDNGLIGGTTKDVRKLQGEVRQYLLDERAQVTSMLALSLDQNRSMGELQMLKLMLDEGMSLDDLPGQVSYALKAEIYNAMSAYALVVAMGSGGH
ncbi:MAG: hypothetical protein P0Y65_09315 [Candidatus Devosia phytovorans]|uniref:Uncharacterized protein n=1 Tax=Candidatus Devosia phytovorans TaxID=3121372 RepID=A0AAJ5VX80_9HYPH|nr:hypothetical protein [Devosia sp.]WEK06419.1 MAG: hypothetical protein P0Y65_09315 [Devosia sp.]